MSRFLFSTFGSLGDLHPYMAVARALIERGHEALIAAADEYRPMLEDAGIEFAPVSPGIAELGDYRTIITRLFDLRRGTEYLIRQLIMPHIRSTYKDQLQASDGADVLVSHPLAFTLPLVAHQLKLPWVSTVLSPISFMSVFDPPVIAAAPWLQKLRILGPKPYSFLFKLLKHSARSWEAPLRDLRKELGLPHSNQMAMFEGQFSPLRNLALFDPQLAKPQPDWPANTRVCGSPIFDGKIQDEAIALKSLDRFLNEGEPPIVFALGSSAVWIAGDFWDKAIAAVKQIGRRAILITGPSIPNSLPDSVAAFPYLPYSKVFPRAAAVVHQAGIGTLAQAMRSGRPQLIVPVAFDQPDNAERAKALGLARVIPFGKVTVQLLASELGMLLDNAAYAESAGTIASDLSKLNGAACAADELISCAEAGKYN